MIFFLIAFLLALPLAQAELESLPPARLTVAQSSPAVSSQAVISQPSAPVRAEEALPARPTPPTKTNSTPAPTEKRTIDPLLDPHRPKDSQLVIETAQTVQCGLSTVVLPPGTYKQVKIMEDPQERRADPRGHLKPQAQGLGYVRYLSDVPLKVDGVERDGGMDSPVSATDGLPLRIWYRKMKDPDDITKAFSFILPPVALIAGAGAWSSGNILLPDSPPTFTEYRDYYLKPTQPKPNLNDIPKPSSARPLGGLSAPGSSNLRSK